MVDEAFDLLGAMAARAKRADDGPRACSGGCGRSLEPFQHVLDNGRTVRAFPHDPCPSCAESEATKAERERVRRMYRSIGMPKKLQAYRWEARQFEPKHRVDESTTAEELEGWTRRWMRGIKGEQTTPGILRVNQSSLTPLFTWDPKEQPHRWWYLEGEVGRGKSLYAAATVMGNVDMSPRQDVTPGAPTFCPTPRTFTAPSSFRVMWETERSLVDRVYRDWAFDPAVLRRLATVDLLVIDEFAPVKPKGKAKRRKAADGAEYDVVEYEDLGRVHRQNVERIIQARYDSERATIFTTNVPLEHIGFVYGSRVQDRLFEMLGVDGRIQLSGPSWRTA